ESGHTGGGPAAANRIRELRIGAVARDGGRALAAVCIAAMARRAAGCKILTSGLTRGLSRQSEEQECGGHWYSLIRCSLRGRDVSGLPGHWRRRGGIARGDRTRLRRARARGCQGYP